MDRITRSHLQSALAAYCTEHDFPLSTGYNVAGYALDYYQPGGNKYTWQLVYTGADGRQEAHHQIENRRYRAEGLYDMLWFATNTHRDQRLAEAR